MSEVEMTKMSSRGQIVVPQDIRERIGATEGTIFAIFGTKDTIVLKRIEMPEKRKLIKELETIAKEGRKRLEKQDIKETDITSIIHRRRGVA